MGWLNPDAMMEQIPFRVFSRWQQYYEIEPFGEERGDLRSAIIAQTVALCHTERKYHHQIKLDSFIPKFEQRQTREEKGQAMMKKVFALNAMFGGTVVGKPPDG